MTSLPDVEVASCASFHLENVFSPSFQIIKNGNTDFILF